MHGRRKRLSLACYPMSKLQRRTSCCWSSVQSWHPSQAAALERIVRKLLARADGPPPALVLVTTRQWCGRSVHGLRRRERPTLKVWEGIEDQFAIALRSLRHGVSFYARRNLPRRGGQARELYRGRCCRRLLLHPEQSGALVTITWPMSWFTSSGSRMNHTDPARRPCTTSIL